MMSFTRLLTVVVFASAATSGVRAGCNWVGMPCTAKDPPCCAITKQWTVCANNTCLINCPQGVLPGMKCKADLGANACCKGACKKHGNDMR